MKKALLILIPIALLLGAAFAPQIIRVADQGEVRFQEDATNGQNFVAVRGAAAITSDATITLPAALPGSTQFVQVDSSGNVSFGNASAATLDSAYDNGPTITADTTPVTITSTTNNALLTVTQNGAVATDAVRISNPAGSGDALEVVSGTARFTGPAAADSTLAVAGAATLASTLSVSGASTLGAATLAGVGTFNSTAAFNGAATFGSTVAVTGVTTLSGHAYFASGRPWVDVRAHGAVGDGAADETSAFQAAANAAHTASAVIFVPTGTYLINVVNVGDNVKGIFGSGDSSIISQRTIDVGGLTWDGTNGCEVQSLLLDGIATSNVDDDDDNCGIRIKSTAGTPAIGDNKNFSIHHCRFKEWKYTAVFAQFVDNLRIEDNLIESCSHGLELWDQFRLTVAKNTLRDTTLTTKYCIGIMVATTDVSTTVHNQDVAIIGNHISNFFTGSSIVVHDGINVAINANVIDEAQHGIAVQPYGAAGTQVVRAVACIGNTVKHRTTTNSATDINNSSFHFAGKDATNKLRSCTVIGNQSFNANHVKSQDGEGGFKFTGYIQNLTCQGNQAFNPRGAGFTFGNTGNNFQIIGNGVFDVDVDASSNQAGIQFRPSCAYTGLMAWNSIEDSSAGIQVLGSGNCSALHTYENRFITVSSEYSLSGGATLGQRVFDTFSTVDIPSILDGDQATGNVTMGGVAIGDYIDVSLSITLGGMGLSAYGSATDTITWLAQNNSGATIDLASATMKFRIRKQ